jgi:hypothetical protein
MQYGFFHSMNENDPSSLVSTNQEPFGNGLKVFTEFSKAKKMRAIAVKQFETYENLIQEHPRKWKYGLHAYTSYRMNYFLYPRTQRLCRGEHVSDFVDLQKSKWP